MVTSPTVFGKPFHDQDAQHPCWKIFSILQPVGFIQEKASFAQKIAILYFRFQNQTGFTQ
jgi:hypothetical protein